MSTDQSLFVSNTAISQKTEPEISTVEEKILLEKQLPFAPNSKKGPTSELYFHELLNEKSFGQKVLYLVGSAFLGISFLLTLPIIALAIKVASRKPIFQKTTVPGRRGIVFERYTFSADRKLGAFLQKMGLLTLPSIINIWKGEMNLVGPHPYPAEKCDAWNKKLSDYYKRFALKPGYISLTERISDHDNIDLVASALRKELRYVQNPTFKKDLRHILGID